MSVLRGVNALVRFGLELCLLAALCYWGFHTHDSLIADLAAGLGAPLLFALAWGAWVAPKAPYRLQDPLRLVLEVAVFTSGTVALLDAGSGTLAALLAVAVAINICLLFLLSQRGSGGV
jgi:Protein of unknown function (DUF2568)